MREPIEYERLEDDASVDEPNLEREEIEIRNLTQQDCERLVKIDAQITGRERRDWYQGKLKAALRESDVQISLGAERDGTLVGAMLGSLHYGEFGQPEPIAVLDTMLVDPGYSRQGVGKALYAQFARNLRALRIERIRTHVSWNHELLGFFRKMGLAPVQRLVLEKTLTKQA